MAKKRNAYEIALPGNRTVVMRELNTSELMKAMETAGTSKMEAVQNFKTGMAGLRMSVAQIDGQDVGAMDIIGEKWDDYFSLVETQLLIKVWGDIHNPTEDQLEAAAGGVQAVAGGT